MNRPDHDDRSGSDRWTVARWTAAFEDGRAISATLTGDDCSVTVRHGDAAWWIVWKSDAPPDVRRRVRSAYPVIVNALSPPPLPPFAATYRPTYRLPLFQWGPTTLSSGTRSLLKIDCDALTPADWAALAEWAAHILPHRHYDVIYPVETGGTPFAEALTPLVLNPQIDDTCRLLIVDDVATTGSSISKVADRGRAGWLKGKPVEVDAIVVFNRGVCSAPGARLFALMETGSIPRT